MICVCVCVFFFFVCVCVCVSSRSTRAIANFTRLLVRAVCFSHVSHVQAEIPSLEHIDVESRMLIGRLLLQQKLQPHGTRMPGGAAATPKHPLALAHRRAAGPQQAWEHTYVATPTIAMTDAAPPIVGSRGRALGVALLATYMPMFTWAMLCTFSSPDSTNLSQVVPPRCRRKTAIDYRCVMRRSACCALGGLHLLCLHSCLYANECAYVF
jgi:hypothetical protein